MKPRILQLIDSFDEGGTERQALQLTRLLYERSEFDVSLACLKPEGVLRSLVNDLDLGPIASYPLTSFYDANALLQLRRLISSLRTLKIQIVHTHDFYTNIFGMAAARIAGVPVRVASRRETYCMRTRSQQHAQRIAYGLAQQIVANSEAVRKALLHEGIEQEKITVIYNGFHQSRNATSHSAFDALRINESVSKNALFVTIVANMRHDVKDYPMFLRTAARVAKVVPQTVFLLAGEGELQQSLENLAAELGITNQTIFLGRVQDIGSLLNISDVCVLTSKAEGFSNAILEYMAAARPVVATDVGGAAEAIVEGETGFLVPSGDDELMAQRVIALLQNRELSKQMGAAGAKVVATKFSIRAQVENTEMLYLSLLHKRRDSITDRQMSQREMITTVDLQ